MSEMAPGECCWQLAAGSHARPSARPNCAGMSTGTHVSTIIVSPSSLSDGAKASPGAIVRTTIRAACVTRFTSAFTLAYPRPRPPDKDRIVPPETTPFEMPRLGLTADCSTDGRHGSRASENTARTRPRPRRWRPATRPPKLHDSRHSTARRAAKREKSVNVIHCLHAARSDRARRTRASQRLSQANASAARPWVSYHRASPATAPPPGPPQRAARPPRRAARAPLAAPPRAQTPPPRARGASYPCAAPRPGRRRRGRASRRAGRRV